jgi:putative toxin-antitoxin system antitoxin component (TIGR02293 family)
MSEIISHAFGKRRNGAGEDLGGGKVLMLALPDPADVERRAPIARICGVLGLPVHAVTALASHLEAAQVGAGATAELVVPRRTLNRHNGQRSTREQSDRLVRIARIVLVAEDVFNNRAKATSWLRGPKPSLGGESRLAFSRPRPARGS